MTSMQFEFPTIVYAHALQNVTTNSSDCEGTYVQFGFNAANSTALCNSELFGNLSTDVKPYFYLMQAYLYGPTYYKVVMEGYLLTLNITQEYFNTTIMGPTSALSTIFKSLQTTVYNFYKDEPFCAKSDL